MQSNIPIANGLIDANLVNSILRENEMTVRWYPSRRCSCWSKIDSAQQASGSPDPSCPYCNGEGRSYPTSENVNGVVLDGMQNIASFSDESGINHTGHIIMFIPSVIGSIPVPMYTGIGLFDLIWAQDITLTTRSVSRRGTDWLRETPIGNVGITYGAQTYQMNVDFSVSGQQVTWISQGPPTGDIYEAAYTFHPWFIVLTAQPIARDFAHLNLPRQVTLELTTQYGDGFPHAYGP